MSQYTDNFCSPLYNGNYQIISKLISHIMSVTATKIRHRRVTKIKSNIRRLNRKLKTQYRKFRQDERAWKSFQTGYRLGILYVFLVKPAQAIDTLDQLLERAKELQNITDATPAEAVGKIAAVRNWLQNLNLSALRQCFTTFGISKLVGCSPCYVMGFVSALLSYKLYKYWKLKQDLDDYVPICLGKVYW